VISVTGKALLEALENSVSAYPALEGRFPQVSNIHFEFDPSKEPDHRISWVTIDDELLDHERNYTLVTRGYMARGKDGFDSLLVESEGGTAKEIVHEENGILISMLLRQYFMSLKILGRWKHWHHGMSQQWKGIHENLHGKHPVIKPRPSGASTPARPGTPRMGLERRKSMYGPSHLQEAMTAEDVEDDQPDSSDDESHQNEHLVKMGELQKREKTIARKVMRKWWRLAGLKGTPKSCDHEDEGELEVDWTHVSSCVLLMEMID
jgi:5'-nucleotidase